MCEKNIVRLFRYPKGRTIRKVMERSGGRAGEVQKNYLRKGKLNEKKLCTSINPKNIHALA